MIFALVLNSLCVCLMIKSNFGISTLSSLPYILSQVFTFLSVGIWNAVVQIICLIILMMITRQLKLGYGLAFVLSFVFGLLVDLFTFLVSFLPGGLIFSIIYFVFGFLFIGFGGALFSRARLPVLPFDLFVRDISIYTKKSYKLIRTITDALFVLATVVISYVSFGKILGVGIGTILSILFMGTYVQRILDFIDDRFVFEPSTKIGEKIIKITEIKTN